MNATIFISGLFSVKNHIVEFYLINRFNSVL